MADIGMQAGRALPQARWADPRRKPTKIRNCARIIEAGCYAAYDRAQRRREARYLQRTGEKRVGAAAAAVRCLVRPSRPPSRAPVPSGGGRSP